MYNDANSLDAIARKDYSVDIGGFLSRGWAIFTQNPLGFLGFSILAGIVIAVISIIPVPFGLIGDMLISGIVLGTISGLFQAGYYRVAFKISQGQSSEFIDFFKGFQNKFFLPIFLASLVMSIILSLLRLPFATSINAAAIRFQQKMLEANSTDPNLTIKLPEIPFPEGITGPLWVVGIILLIPAIYLGVAYSFSIPLIMDKQINFWPAMETSRKLLTKKWFPYFGFSIVLGLINLGGFLACCIGVIFTAPLTICAVAAAYENIVGLSGEE